MKLFSDVCVLIIKPTKVKMEIDKKLEMTPEYEFVIIVNSSKVLNEEIKEAISLIEDFSNLFYSDYIFKFHTITSMDSDVFGQNVVKALKKGWYIHYAGSYLKRGKPELDSEQEYEVFISFCKENIAMKTTDDEFLFEIRQRLETQLKEAVDNDNFEKAAELRDKIDKLK